MPPTEASDRPRRTRPAPYRWLVEAALLTALAGGLLTLGTLPGDFGHWLCGDALCGPWG